MLSTIASELKKGYHILHIVAHGTFGKSKGAVLYLANAFGEVALVGADRVEKMLRQQSDHLPHLIFLCSCQTATRSPADAFRGFAPKLLEAGVPAVVAMQDLVPVKTAGRFARTFYRQLLEHGLVDLAGNEARAAVLTADLPGSAIPVLFSRLPDNQLFATKARLPIDPTTGEVSSVTIGDVGGDIRNSIIAGRDVIQVAEDLTNLKMPNNDLQGQLDILNRALPELVVPFHQNEARATIAELKEAIDALPTHEQAYCQSVRDLFAEDAAYYIPLKGEATEERVAKRGDSPLSIPRRTTPRAARRRKRRGQAQAEFHQLEQVGQETQRIKLNTLREAVDRYDRLILLGDPGSGKTTALEHLAYQFADGIEKIPLPLRLSEFEPGLLRLHESEPRLKAVENFIVQGWAGSLKAGHWGMPELAANLRGYLEEGKLFILFDALNEMPAEHYDEQAGLLRDFIDKWAAKGNRFMMTCRVLDYGKHLTGLKRVEVQPLSDDQITAFLQKERPDDWTELWAELNENGATQNRQLLTMARNPYILTMMIDVFAEQGYLGQNQAELMTEFTQDLLNRDEDKYSVEEWLDADIQREVLSIVAFDMQERPDAGTMIKTYDIVLPHKIRPGRNLIPTPSLDRVLTLAHGAKIVEMPVNHSSVRFYHQLLQEYFAARELLKRLPPSNSPQRGEDSFSSPPLGGIEGGLSSLWRWKWKESETPLWVRPENNYDPIPPPETTGWEETTILAAGLAPENDDQLVRTLNEINPVLAGR
ncbi:MAG: CHAT domain-containing protein, partial [Chloroflexi bacterium]|nr:CHAT domain-containing protein [Chloroflexota bacterium]